MWLSWTGNDRGPEATENQELGSVLSFKADAFEWRSYYGVTFYNNINIIVITHRLAPCQLVIPGNNDVKHLRR